MRDVDAEGTVPAPSAGDELWPCRAPDERASASGELRATSASAWSDCWPCGEVSWSSAGEATRGVRRQVAPGMALAAAAGGPITLAQRTKSARDRPRRCTRRAGRCGTTESEVDLAYLDHARP